MFASAMQQRSRCSKPFQALLYISTTWRRAATLQRVTPREGAGGGQHDQLIARRQQRGDSPSVDESRKLDDELTPGGEHERVPRVLLVPPLGARAHDQLLVHRLHAQVVQVVLAGEVEHELELVSVVPAVLTDERAVAVGRRAEGQRRLHEDGRVLRHVKRTVVDATHETPDVDARGQVALRDQRAAVVETAHAQHAVLDRHADVVDRVRPDVDARAERARSARQRHVRFRFRLHGKQPRRRVRRRARTGARTAVSLADGGELLAQFVLALLVLHAHGAVESRRRAVIRDLARRQRTADAWNDGNALAATDLSAGAVGGRVLMSALLLRTAADELESAGQFKERLLPGTGTARRRARPRGHAAPAGGVDGT